jgi:hypothetical protein
VTLTTETAKALKPVMAKLRRLPPDEQITSAEHVNAALLAAQADTASVRRSAVRELRAQGFTLQAIGDLCGMSPQRIQQIEVGYGRQEKRARGSK